LNALSRNAVELEPIEIIRSVERIFAKPKEAEKPRPEFTRAATNPNFKTASNPNTWNANNNTNTKLIGPRVKFSKGFNAKLLNTKRIPVKALPETKATAITPVTLTETPIEIIPTAPIELLTESFQQILLENEPKNDLSSILADLQPNSIYEEADLLEDVEEEDLDDQSDTASYRKSSRATSAIIVSTCASAFSEKSLKFSDKNFEETKAALKMNNQNLKNKVKFEEDSNQTSADLKLKGADIVKDILKAPEIKDISKVYNIKRPILVNRQNAMLKREKNEVNKVPSSTSVVSPVPSSTTPTLHDTSKSPIVQNGSMSSTITSENKNKSIKSTYEDKRIKSANEDKRIKSANEDKRIKSGSEKKFNINITKANKSNEKKEVKEIKDVKDVKDISEF